MPKESIGWGGQDVTTHTDGQKDMYNANTKDTHTQKKPAVCTDTHNHGDTRQTEVINVVAEK